jgi:hypothetical protein
MARAESATQNITFFNCKNLEEEKENNLKNEAEELIKL